MIDRNYAEIEQREATVAVPVGSLVPFAGTAAPSGSAWLLCDGAAVSRTDYAALFAVVGTAYGVGDGTTTFNVPDLRGRVPVGIDDMGGTDAGRLSVANTIGGSGGEQSHTLTVAEMPPHTHANATTARTMVLTGGEWAISRTAAEADRYQTGSAGSGGAHNNMQPYLLTNYLIRAGA